MNASVCVEGVVVRGLQLARTLGYPTMNISYVGTLGAQAGVYAARVHGGVFSKMGAAVVGGDFVESLSPKCEVHVFDFDEDCYGQTITIELCEQVSDLEKISDEKKLIEKIENDVEKVKKYFKNQ